MPSTHRLQPFDPAAPYDGLRPLPPRDDVESRAILKACIEARVALAELNMATHVIANQAALMNALPLLEAHASADLEDLATTPDQLFRSAACHTRPTDPAVGETLLYPLALKRGIDSLNAHPVTTATAVDVCRTLCGCDADIRRSPGTALTNQAGALLYTPPHGEALIRDLLANWESYLHDETSVDPLIRMAIGHYQFEAIRPFSAGNGPTGRILSVLYLVEQQLLELPLLAVSRAVRANQPEYFRRLNDVTRFGAWEPWILYFVDAVRETARWTAAKIRAMRTLLLETTRHVQGQAPSLYRRELVELLFVKPCCRIADVVEAGLAKRQTASVDLKKLARIGVLDEVKAGRDKLFIHANLVTLLTSERHEYSHYTS